MFSLSKSTKKRVPIASKMQSGRSGERVLIVNVYVSVIVGGGCVLDVVEIEAPPTSYVWDTYPSRSLSPAAVVRVYICIVLRRVSLALRWLPSLRATTHPLDPHPSSKVVLC